jgi:hypothetical protein
MTRTDKGAVPAAVMFHVLTGFPTCPALFRFTIHFIRLPAHLERAAPSVPTLHAPLVPTLQLINALQ